jgi:23S rRNA (pseudouridine1915-N3)-methyltransferase
VDSKFFIMETNKSIMQKIKILAVGKIKNSNVRAELEEFLKRLSPYASISIQELKDEGIKKESAKIAVFLDEHKNNVFVLDALGKQLSSEEFSVLLGENQKTGEEVIFVIGGPDGIDDAVKRKAKMIALSRMTFTHEVARLLLVEQIYRVFMILNNRPYHK